MIRDIDETRQPLLEHLTELRRRLLWSIAALAVAFGISLYFARPIFAFLVQPLLRAGQGKLVYTDIFEAFFAQMKVAFFTACMLAFPIVVNQIWRFVAPGLYAKEKRALLPFLLMTPVLFIAGAALAYYVAMPLALTFLLGRHFQGNIGGIDQEALPAVGNYLSFVTKFLFGFGAAFLMPILLMLLERAGIVSRAQLVSSRRYAIVGSFAIACVLAPPDAVSMLVMAVPLCLLYEFALVAIWFTEKKRKREAIAAGSTI